MKVAIALLGTAGILAADDWTRFRGPNGSGVSDASGLPTEFGPSKNLVWKTAVPFARSSPIVVGNRVFITANEGEKLITMCLDRDTGKIVWRREVIRTRAMPIYKGNDPASPSPVSDGKNVYAFFPDLGLISYGPDGNERWRLPLGPFKGFYGLASSPVLSGDTLLLNCDTRKNAFLLAVDASTGKIRWRAERKEIDFDGYTSPVIYEPKGQPAQVIVLGAHRIDSYAVNSGERVWWFTGLAFFPVASPVIAKDMLLVSTWGSDTPVGPTFDELLKKYDTNKDGRLSRDEVKGEAELYDQFGAMDLNDDGFFDRGDYDEMQKGSQGDYGLIAVRLGGRGDVSKTAVAWRDKKNWPTMASVVVFQDVLYVVKTGGIIAALNPHTGEVYKVGRAKEALDEYYSSPVAADGKVFLANEPGKVAVLKAGQQWDVLAVNDLGEECYATPAIADGRIFVRTRNAMYSFGRTK
jgi:outer membrane protein assembly factor BamB